MHSEGHDMAHLMAFDVLESTLSLSTTSCVVCIMSEPILSIRRRASPILSKSRRPVWEEELLATGLGYAMRERERELRLQQLLDVGALDVGGLLNLNHLQDLRGMSVRNRRT